MDTVAPFRAFVSYCDADRAFAARLQRRLETYRLPKRLSDQVAPLAGQAPGRIGPIFRDRADLSASEDLSAAVRDAIARSSALVVVASPDAASSHWVAREIALFRELHPEAPVLVALARGEPAEAMPEALRTAGTEPLAADFRKQGDGSRLAFLKIVAGLAGLPLDALVRRDAQRQLRRVTAVTGAAGVLLLIMALLLATTLRAREEAERRRAGAEGLVEFMRTTLRDRLKGVGSVPVMREVNERALAYFDAEGGDTDLSDESILLRAQVLQALGEDDMSSNRIGAGRAKFSEAYRTSSAVLQRHPRQADAVFVHAQSEYFMGAAALKTADRAEARRYWQRYRDYAGILATIEPRSARSLMELAYSEGNLCALDYDGSVDLNSASRHCQASVSFVKTATHIRPDPSTIEALANRYGWLARVQLAQHSYEAAIASRKREAGLVDRLLKLDPANADYAMHRAWPDIGIAKALILTGEPDKAETLLRQRWEIYKLKLNEERSIDFWETGLRLLFFIEKAERKVSVSVSGSSVIRSDIDSYISKFEMVFPDGAAKAESVRREFL